MFVCTMTYQATTQLEITKTRIPSSSTRWAWCWNAAASTTALTSRYTRTRPGRRTNWRNSASNSRTRWLAAGWREASNISAANTFSRRWINDVCSNRRETIRGNTSAVTKGSFNSSAIIRTYSSAFLSLLSCGSSSAPFWPCFKCGKFDREDRRADDWKERKSDGRSGTTTKSKGKASGKSFEVLLWHIKDEFIVWLNALITPYWLLIALIGLSSFSLSSAALAHRYIGLPCLHLCREWHMKYRIFFI